MMLVQTREVILGLFQKHKSIKKKQVVDNLSAVGVTLTDKALTATLKVCVCVCVWVGGCGWVSECV